MWIAPSLLDDIIDRTLAEDLASGDITTEATVPPDTQAVATAIARAPLVVCGGLVFGRVFHRLEPAISIEEILTEGAKATKGAALWRVRGSAHALLMAERTALNLVQRMSGIATLTRSYTESLPQGCTTCITDTRKTTPGLRALERYAVRTGGAHNHRDNLGSAVLIKDNHIIAAGGISIALERARARAPHPSRIEIEVANLDELDQALQAHADIILLDNFSLSDLRKAVTRTQGRALLEASGGVTLATVRAIAETGVDVISVGALTHSAPAANIALDLTLTPLPQ